MKFQARDVESVTVVDIEGNLTIGRGETLLGETIARLLEAGRKRIVLNLAGVPYMDSAGIGELVACTKRAGAVGAVIKLLDPTPKVREILRITRFEKLFEIHESEPDAVGSFSATR